MKHAISVLAVGALLTTACTDRPTDPSSEVSLTPAVQLAKGGVPDLARCATDPDFIVTTGEQLRSAMATDAQPGDVIAVEGLILIDQGTWTLTDGLTITCASPGSGIAADPNVPWVPGTGGYLLLIFSRDVVVTGLVLDAAAAPAGPIYAENNGVGRFADRLVFTDNDVTCGPGSCLFFPGVSNGLVANNRFLADGASTGVHIQGVGNPDPTGRVPFPTDGTRVLGNTVVNLSPSPETEVNWANFAGIRVRDGDGVTVVQNRVEGPWIHTLSVAGLRTSTVSQNSGSGAKYAGINTRDVSSSLWSSGNVFRNNQITGAGWLGLLAVGACYNTFVGNNLGGSGWDITAGFDVTTGGNTFVGNGTTAVDLGAWDCDGNGSLDPNRITGARQIHGGLHLGPMIRGTATAYGTLMK